MRVLWLGRRFCQALISPRSRTTAGICISVVGLVQGIHGARQVLSPIYRLLGLRTVIQTVKNFSGMVVVLRRN